MQASLPVIEQNVGKNYGQHTLFRIYDKGSDLKNTKMWNVSIQ